MALVNIPPSSTIEPFQTDARRSWAYETASPHFGATVAAIRAAPNSFDGLRSLFLPDESPKTAEPQHTESVTSRASATSHWTPPRPAQPVTHLGRAPASDEWAVRAAPTPVLERCPVGGHLGWDGLPSALGCPASGLPASELPVILAGAISTLRRRNSTFRRTRHPPWRQPSWRRRPRRCLRNPSRS